MYFKCFKKDFLFIGRWRHSDEQRSVTTDVSTEINRKDRLKETEDMGISQWESYDTFTVNQKTLFLVQPDFLTISLKGTPSSASLLMLYL